MNYFSTGSSSPVKSFLQYEAPHRECSGRYCTFSLQLDKNPNWNRQVLKHTYAPYLYHVTVRVFRQLMTTNRKRRHARRWILSVIQSYGIHNCWTGEEHAPCGKQPQQGQQVNLAHAHTAAALTCQSSKQTTSGVSDVCKRMDIQHSFVTGASQERRKTKTTTSAAGLWQKASQWGQVSMCSIQQTWADGSQFVNTNKEQKQQNAWQDEEHERSAEPQKEMIQDWSMGTKMNAKNKHKTRHNCREEQVKDGMP